MRIQQTKQQKKSALFFRRTMAAFTSFPFTVSANSAYAAQPYGDRNDLLLGFAMAALSIVVPTDSAMARDNVNQRLSFREYRKSNDGLDRHLARNLFREVRQLEASDSRLLRSSNIRNSSLSPVSTGQMGNTVQLFRARERDTRVKNRTFQLDNVYSRSLKLTQRLELDLTSSNRNIVLGNKLFDDIYSIDISVGDKTKTVTAGSKVSAAEYIATKQVIAGSGQQIVIDSAGRAIAGEVDLAAITSNHDVLKASSLTVSNNVTAYGNFAKGSDFRLLGDLENFGSIRTLSTDATIRGGAIRADNILNHMNAVIHSESDLTLAADRKLLNDGTITSAQNLTIEAGSILNKGRIAATNNLTTLTPSLKNTGEMSSISGDVLLNAADDSHLLVSNKRGVISAEQGAINIRGIAYNGIANSLISGGDLYSQKLVINAGGGTVDTRVEDLTGVVYQTGYASRIAVSTPLLTIGDTTLVDPTYFNAAGSIHLAGNINIVQELVVAASENVTTADNLTILCGNSKTGRQITFIAGANIVPEDPARSRTVVGPLPPIVPGEPGAINILGGSKSGGSITIGAGTTISSRSNDATEVEEDLGGGVTLHAFAGKTLGSGRVDAGGATISVAGRGGGPGGTISVSAGAANTESITLGTLDATGGNSGSIRVITCQPNLVSGYPRAYSESGSLISGGGALGDPRRLSKNASIKVAAGGVLDADSLLSIRSSGALNWEGSSSSADIVDVRIDGDIVGGSIAAGSEIHHEGGNFGIESNPVTVNSADLYLTSSGVRLIGTGDIRVTQGLIDNDFFATGPATAPFSAGYLEAKNVNLNVGQVRTSEIDADTLSIVSTSSDEAFPSNSVFRVDTLTVEAEGTVDFTISNTKIKNISISGKDLDVRSDLTTAVNFTKLEAEQNIRLTAVGPITLSSGASATTGSIDLFTIGRSMKLEGVIQAKTGVALEVDNTKGKLTLNDNVVVSTTANLAGQGNIHLSVGPETTIPFTSAIKNLSVSGTGGSALFTGTGLKASSPMNTLSYDGANITINNGIKSGNIILGGNVQVNAE